MTEHVEGRQERQEFHRELGAIEAKVIELFTTVAEDVPRATDALLNGNSEAVRALAERDRVIDGLYPEIEELADREMLLQQPVASDFRLLVSVLRVVPELERSHDLIVDIARRGNLIPQPGPVGAQPGADRAYGEARIGDVARGGGLLVRARPFRCGCAG
jgi:Phosphate uptake regulator